MTGRAELDPLLCVKYARFASHLDRWHFKVIYFTLFIANLFLLFLGSFFYTKGQDVIERLSNNAQMRAKALRIYILLSVACVLMSATVVIIEAFALLALQFCDGEDLMSLYWSTWTMLQVGSLIALLGIVLALLFSHRDRKHPPWALALGTPVLVIAGILHLIHDCSKKRIKGLRASGPQDSPDDEQGPPISQANTIQTSDGNDKCSAIHADFVGFTIQGGPIVRFAQPVPAMPEGELIGCDASGRSTFAFPRGVVQFDAQKDGSN
ncbi:hypothetical protein E4U57_004066 [Claviceps arundinis]|uniref:Uncharacterized protein n=1 Tax=Claviceps arundinis TaxID=1623583 RepID=A0A9P7SS68_9HYPO|nr:hypothetical protein E4U57_004066 [Claviceps arundinis]KAG5972557.1 hypothetical protein E4U56_005885 [Claviceps arundinis]